MAARYDGRAPSCRGQHGDDVGSPANSGGFAGWYVQLTVTAVLVLAPGDYLEGSVYQSSAERST